MTAEGETYFVDIETEESMWERPKGAEGCFVYKLTPVQLESWRAVATSDGKEYYVNLMDESVTWELPDGLKDCFIPPLDPDEEFQEMSDS